MRQICEGLLKFKKKSPHVVRLGKIYIFLNGIPQEVSASDPCELPKPYNMYRVWKSLLSVCIWFSPLSQVQSKYALRLLWVRLTFLLKYKQFKILVHFPLLLIIILNSRKIDLNTYWKTLSIRFFFNDKNAKRCSTYISHNTHNWIFCISEEMREFFGWDLSEH